MSADPVVTALPAPESTTPDPPVTELGSPAPIAMAPSTAEVLTTTPVAAASAAVVEPAVAVPSSWHIALAVAGSHTLHFDDGTVVFGDLARALDLVTDIAVTGTDGDDHLSISFRPLASGRAIGVSFAGGAGSDTLAGPDHDARWTVTGVGAGALLVGALQVDFTGVEHLSGAAANQDTFVLQGAGHVGGVDGGAGGFDTLVLDGGGFSSIASTVSGPQSGTVVRDGLVTAYDGLEPITITPGSCSGVCTVSVTDTADHQISVTSTGPDNVTVTFTDGSGESTSITAAAAFDLTIAGNTGDDEVTVGLLPAVVGTFTVDGGGGSNTIVVTRDADMVLTATSLTVGTQVINLLNVLNAILTGGAGANTFTVDASWTGLAMIDGAGGDDTLVGPDADTDWSITGADSGATDTVVFANVERLAGGSGGDVFAFDGGTISGSLDGGAGSDAIVAADEVNAWAIDTANGGDLNGTSFTDVENLVGGSADDTFVFGAGGSVSGVIEGGPDDADADVPAVDTIDYSAKTAPVAVTLTGGALSAAFDFSPETTDADPGAGVLRLNRRHRTWPRSCGSTWRATTACCSPRCSTPSTTRPGRPGSSASSTPATRSTTSSSPSRRCRCPPAAVTATSPSPSSSSAPPPRSPPTRRSCSPSSRVRRSPPTSAPSSTSTPSPAAATRTP